MKRLLRAAPVQTALAWLLGAYLRLALATTRWQFPGSAHAAPAFAGHPSIAACWHGCLPLMPPFWRLAQTQARAQGRTLPPLAILVSRHRDGRLIGALMRRFGMLPIHGSSSRGGAAALRACARALAAGHHLALTPDGPRGPAMEAAPGIARLAALTGAPILPLGAATTHCRILPTWDRMRLPLPFGRGVVVCEPAIQVPRHHWQQALPEIEAALTRAATRAQTLCHGS